MPARAPRDPRRFLKILACLAVGAIVITSHSQDTPNVVVDAAKAQPVNQQPDNGEDSWDQKRMVLGYIAHVAPDYLLIRCGNVEKVADIYACFDDGLNDMKESELPSGTTLFSRGPGVMHRYWNLDECARRQRKLAGSVCNVR